MLARYDLHSFSGRKHEIQSITKAFSSYQQRSKIVYNVFGISGIGKSSLLHYIYNTDVILSDFKKIFIDFSFQNERCIIDIVSKITCVFLNCFEKTINEINKYYNSIDANKPQLLNVAITSFLQELNDLSNHSQILIMLDTYEVVQNSSDWLNIERIIIESGNHVCFIVSGKEKNKNNYITNSLEVLGFGLKDVTDYFSTRNPSLKKEFKKSTSIVAEKIRSFTKNGHPILCGLVSDWLLQSPSQVNFLLDNNLTISEKQLISWILNCPVHVKDVLVLMAYFTQRMDLSIINALLSLDDDESKTIMNKIGEYSFVKYYPDDSNLILHDIVARLIRKYLALDNIALIKAFNKIISVYDLKMSEAKNLYSQTTKSCLLIEKASYVILYERTSDALSFIDNELTSSLEVYDFSLYDMILQAVSRSNLSDKEGVWSFFLKNAEIDKLVAKCNPRSAIERINEVKNSMMYQNDLLFNAKINEAYARCIINPCTNEKLDLHEAIHLFIDCISTYKKFNFVNRLVRSYIGLGITYVRIGLSIDAALAFDQAEKLCFLPVQKMSILLEKSKMLRLQQKVPESLVPLLKCETIMQKLNINKGKYFYYFGNTLRDLGDFILAEEKYETALKELETTQADNFTLCELYLDYAWMEYLRSEHANFCKVDSLLNRGWDIAKRFCFGTEYSEYYHIQYEIERDKENYEVAFHNLDIALKYAKKYSNILILLDCLNHKVQQYYFQGFYHKIPSVLKKMEHYEKLGCGIRVFRGRAKLVFGDVLYETGNYSSALKEYIDGFVTVALYGDSRTNCELFDDLFYCYSRPGELSRKDKLLFIISELAYAKHKIKSIWYKSRVDKKYDYFISDLCS